MSDVSDIKPVDHLKCIGCSNIVPLFSHEQFFACCPKCRTTYVKKEGETSFSRANFNTTEAALDAKIELYKEGTIDGKVYRVIGIERLKENGKRNFWNEYILKAKDGETITLANFENIWLKVSHLRKVLLGKGVVKHKFENVNHKLELFNNYGAEMVECVGEIPYDVVQRARSRTFEWISVNSIYIEELDPKSKIKTDYRAEYIDAKVIKKEFAKKYIDTSNNHHPLLPYNGPKLRTLIGSTFVFALVTLLALMYFNQAPKSIVLEETYPVNIENVSVGEIVTEEFEIRPTDVFNGKTNLDIQLNTMLSNNWLDLFITLVNVKTGKTITLNKTLEYYSGVEDGYSWSEGGNSANLLLSSIDTGKYRLVLEPFNDRTSTEKSLTIFPKNEVTDSLSKAKGGHSFDDKVAVYNKTSSSKVEVESKVFSSKGFDDLTFTIKVTQNETVFLNFFLIFFLYLIVFGIYLYRYVNYTESKWYLSNIKRPYQWMRDL